MGTWLHNREQIFKIGNKPSKFGVKLQNYRVSYKGKKKAKACKSSPMIRIIRMLDIRINSTNSRISPRPWAQNTYGWRRLEVVGALANSGTFTRHNNVLKQQRCFYIYFVCLQVLDRVGQKTYSNRTLYSLSCSKETLQIILYMNLVSKSVQRWTSIDYNIH